MSTVALPLPPIVQGLPVVGRALSSFDDPVALIERGHRAPGSIFAISLVDHDLRPAGGMAANEPASPCRVRCTGRAARGRAHA